MSFVFDTLKGIEPNFPKPHLSDQALLEISKLGTSYAIEWGKEWARLYDRYRDLENKFEALTENVGETPVDFVAVVKDLKELSGDSVKFDYWNYKHTDNVEFTLWSSRREKNYTGKTFAEVEEKFRADFAKPEAVGSVETEL